MLNWIRIIYHAVVEAIRKELAFRRFLRNLRENPPESTKWRDAVSKVTLEEWKTAVRRLGYSLPNDTPEPPRPKPHAKRKRTKFKKWWPHGKRSG